MRRLIARLLAGVDGRTLPPAERLRFGWPRGALILAVALPALAAGPLRFLTGMGLGACYAISLLSTIALLAPLARALGTRSLSKPQELATHVALAIVAVFAALLTYNRHFAGLPQYLAPDGWGGADGGYHIMNYMDFTRRTPNVYGGFVSIYSFWDATRRLGSTHLLVGLNVCFGYIRIVVAAAPCTIAFATLWRWRADPRAWWSGAAACVVATLAVQYLVVLPLENFHLMAGFWPHLLGLVPLMLLWLADALVRPRLLRLCLMLAAIVLYRFTYGFNLADLLAAIGALLLLEAIDRHATATPVRVALVGVAIAAFWSSRYCFLLTTRLFKDWGWIVDHDVTAATHGILLTVVALGASICAWPSRSAAPSSGSGIVRALRFPLFCSLATVLYLTLIERIPPATNYYFQKYDFHALVLAGCATVVAATFAVTTLVAGGSRASSLRAIVALAFAVAGVVTMHRSIASYQRVFHEQVYGGHYSRSYPWVMPATVNRIQTTLDREKKAFGGYLTPHYGTRLVTNGLFDYGDRNWMRYPKLDLSPGHCIFWVSARGYTPDTYPEKVCETYAQIPWGKLTVCSACY